MWRERANPKANCCRHTSNCQWKAHLNSRKGCRLSRFGWDTNLYGVQVNFQVKAPGKSTNMSSSDEFLSKPTRENNNNKLLKQMEVKQTPGTRSLKRRAQQRSSGISALTLGANCGLLFGGMHQAGQPSSPKCPSLLRHPPPPKQKTTPPPPPQKKQRKTKKKMLQGGNQQKRVSETSQLGGTLIFL